MAALSAAPATWLNVAELPRPTIGSFSPVVGMARVMTLPACANNAWGSAKATPACAVSARYLRRVSIGLSPRKRLAMGRK